MTLPGDRLVDVWWVRHGESVRNAGHRTVDTYNAPMTELGQQQADLAAAALPSAPELLVTSSFLRAQQTARAVSRRFPAVPLETWDVHEFHFLCDEKTRGTNRAEREPMVHEYWERCDPAHVHGVGAESFRQFVERVDAALDRLRRRPERWVVVASHQHFMLGVMFRLAMPGAAPDVVLMRRFRDYVLEHDVPNAALVRTLLTGSGRDTVWPAVPVTTPWTAVPASVSASG